MGSAFFLSPGRVYPLGAGSPLLNRIGICIAIRPVVGRITQASSNAGAETLQGQDAMVGFFWSPCNQTGNQKCYFKVRF